MFARHKKEEFVLARHKEKGQLKELPLKEEMQKSHQQQFSLARLQAELNEAAAERAAEEGHSEFTSSHTNTKICNLITTVSNLFSSSI